MLIDTTCVSVFLASARLSLDSAVASSSPAGTPTPTLSSSPSPVPPPPPYVIRFGCTAPLEDNDPNKCTWHVMNLMWVPPEQRAAMRELMGRLLRAQYPVLAWWGVLTVLTRAAATISGSPWTRSWKTSGS